MNTLIKLYTLSNSIIHIGGLTPADASDQLELWLRRDFASRLSLELSKYLPEFTPTRHLTLEQRHEAAIKVSAMAKWMDMLTNDVVDLLKLNLRDADESVIGASMAMIEEYLTYMRKNLEDIRVVPIVDVGECVPNSSGRYRLLTYILALQDIHRRHMQVLALQMNPGEPMEDMLDAAIIVARRWRELAELNLMFSKLAPDHEVFTNLPRFGGPNRGEADPMLEIIRKLTELANKVYPKTHDPEYAFRDGVPESATASR